MRCTVFADCAGLEGAVRASHFALWRYKKLKLAVRACGLSFIVGWVLAAALALVLR